MRKGRCGDQGRLKICGVDENRLVEGGENFSKGEVYGQENVLILVILLIAGAM